MSETEKASKDDIQFTEYHEYTHKSHFILAQKMKPF